MADTAFKTGTPGNFPPFFTHTAAPWHAERGCIYVGEGNAVHCLAEVYGGAVATKAEADADARLIAASPELLASLLALLDANHSGEPVRIARAVWTGLALLARLSNSAVIGLNAEPEPNPDTAQFKRQAPACAVGAAGAAVLAMGGAA
jgi:hypothetical protein